MRSVFGYVRRMLSEIQMDYRFNQGGRPKPTDGNLLREVIATGFWSNDGVCHYCGKFDADYKTHETYCLAKSLIAWATANGVELQDRDNVFPTAAELAAERKRVSAENEALLGPLPHPLSTEAAIAAGNEIIRLWPKDPTA